MSQRKPGRPRSSEPKTHRIQVRLGDAGLQTLDRLRGDTPTSDYIRRLIWEEDRRQR